MADIPKQARVVIIGGGISGCSVAYHLAKLGWTDIVLLERKQLTSGTTWHAAGLVGQLRASQNMTRLAKYSTDLYADLAAETGLATGFRHRRGRAVTTAEAVIPVMGPRARDLLRLVSPDDFSNTAHPFGMAREIEIGMGLARAHRVSYVGELGWELYVSTDQAAHVFETLLEAGERSG